jgi:hypothetical protein
MATSESGSIKAIAITNYVAVFVLFGGLHFLFPQASEPFIVQYSSGLFDWLLFTSILASTWSLWLVMSRQRCYEFLGIWTMLRVNLGLALAFFLISAAIFVISAIQRDIPLPAGSNLMDTHSVKLIVNYCRLPILSHPVALYILGTAMTYKLISGPNDFRRATLVGGIVLFAYYFLMYAAGVVSSDLLRETLATANGTKWLMIFIYWMPTVLISFAAYIAYALAFRRD